ncbi:MAG: exodeoxyribonuclease III [Treponemataceae bacterium]|nr:exodeoxyribonuclease III [Treponemataceae bacterium]
MFSVISWNVNGIRSAERKDFKNWIASCGADVVCVQETKANPGQLSKTLKEAGSYKSYFSSARKPGYSGVAIYSRTEPDKVEIMNDSRFDDEGRFLAASYGDLVLITAYFPNSQEAGKRLDFKMEFNKAIKEYCLKILKSGKHVLLSGDYNVAHKPIDLANPEENENFPGYFLREREWMDDFTASGFVDTFRHFCSQGQNYTWWSYSDNARERNIGWRIDYHCVDEGLLSKVLSSSILKDVYGSDHCPIKIELDI